MANDKELQIRRANAIRAFRWQTIKENGVLWFLFILSILFSIVCPVVINSFFSVETHPNTNAIISGIANISYGYLSGFLVYLFGTFLSSTKKHVEQQDNIFFQLTLIYDSLLKAEERFISYTPEVCSKEYQVVLYNHLVSGFTIKNDIIEIDLQPDFPLVNEDHYSTLLSDLEYTSTLLNEFIGAYRMELESKEMEVINKVRQLAKSLEETIEIHLPTYSNSVRRYDNKHLILFVSDFYFHFRTQFVYLCKKYEKFKYCDYEINS